MLLIVAIYGISCYIAERLNAVNSNGNLSGVDQAISNIAADAVDSYYQQQAVYDEGTKINLKRARSELKATSYNEPSPVNWYELSKSSLGIIGNTATIVTGAGLDIVGVAGLAAPDPTTVTKWGGVAALTTGTALIVKGEAGLSLNFANFLTAIKGGKSYLPGSGIELLAKQKFGESRTVQNFALAADMTIDLFTNPVLGSTKFATNSFGVALKNGTPALLQAPRSTNLMKEFLMQSPQINNYTNVAGKYSGLGSSFFADYQLGIDYKLWK